MWLGKSTALSWKKGYFQNSIQVFSEMCSGGTFPIQRAAWQCTVLRNSVRWDISCNLIAKSSDGEGNGLSSKGSTSFPC